MKRMLLLLLCAAAALSLTACGKSGGEKSEEAQIANPIVEYETLAEAEKAVGFTMTAPETFNRFADRTVQVIGGKLLQLTYLNDHGQRLILRKAVGDEDISGDYNQYPQNSMMEWDNGGATFKGEDDMFSVAAWTADGFAFSMTTDEPMSEGDVLSLISRVN